MSLTSFLIRFLDLALTLAALLIFALPMVIIAALIYLEDHAPILFRQPRVGKAARVFEIYKFRTMYNDASRSVGQAEDDGDLDDARTRFVTTSQNDPRITKVGRILRPLHLDELPQLLNVLNGDMSLVGVRPDVPVQQADYTPFEWTQRHVFRPGITGLAQVNPNIESLADRTSCDLKWVTDRSLKLYVKILFLTVAKVAKRNSL